MWRHQPFDLPDLFGAEGVNLNMHDKLPIDKSDANHVDVRVGAMEKLGADTRVQAIVYAQKLQLI
jgi:hypothetical protein